jgi:thioesterase domain-containing protein
MPVTQRLGVRLVDVQHGTVRLRAPFAANTNHAGTAFAGSLNAVATLSGWATVWLLLRERDIRVQVVIQDSSVRYLRPVTGDFEALCTPPSHEAITHLVDSVTRRGKGRIELAIAVHDDQGKAVHFRGRYVALREGPRGTVRALSAPASP